MNGFTDQIWELKLHNRVRNQKEIVYVCFTDPGNSPWTWTVCIWSGPYDREFLTVIKSKEKKNLDLVIKIQINDT